MAEGLDEMLAATIQMLGADFGNIQLLNDTRTVLTIEAQRGFKQEFLDVFREVSADHGSAAGRTLRLGERIIVEDVELDEAFAPLLHVVRSAGFRAVQSTALLGRDGECLGIISIHFRAVHRPSEQEQRLLDLCARQASDFIERCRADEALQRARSQIEAELADTKLLAMVSAEMAREGSVQGIYEKIIDAAVSIMRSDYASMQMLYPERGDNGELRLLAFRGFNPQAAKFWEWVGTDSKSTCGFALASGQRSIEPDVANSQLMAETSDQATYLQTGILAVQSTPLLSREGKLVGMISTHWKQPHQSSDRDLRLLDVLARQAADLIAREKADDELRDAKVQAEAANRAKTDFLSAMSHELRTPLNAIGGYAQLLELGIHGSITDAQRDALTRLQRSQQHLLALINNILDFAKLEAGRVDYTLREVQLAEAVADLGPMIEPQIAAKGLDYKTQIATDVVVQADREKLQQVLLNLLANAVKFTESGGRITVDVSTRRDGGGEADVIFVRVADTGIGIPREKQNLIFDPFLQLIQDPPRTDGAGLGLAISRDLARGMGGDLRVRSFNGQGSTFTLTLLRGART